MRYIIHYKVESPEQWDGAEPHSEIIHHSTMPVEADSPVEAIELFTDWICENLTHGYNNLGDAIEALDINGNPLQYIIIWGADVF